MDYSYKCFVSVERADRERRRVRLCARLRRVSFGADDKNY